MSDNVYKMTSHLPMYILGAIILLFLFFAVFFKRNNDSVYVITEPGVSEQKMKEIAYQTYSEHFRQNTNKEYPDTGRVQGGLYIENRFFQDPNINPNIMTFGNHNSAHTSAINASPYIPIPGINLPPVSPGVDLPPYRYH